MLSLRQSMLMVALGMGGAIALLLQACQVHPQALLCGELHKEYLFDSAQMMPNGTHGLFTASKHNFYLCEYCGGDCNQYATNLDRWLIGTYNVRTNAINVLNRSEQSDPMLQTAVWRIQSIAGSRAFLIKGTRSPNSSNRQEGSQPLREPYYWLNLGSGQLTLIPLRSELAVRNLLSSRYPAPQLLDEAGTLLFSIGEFEYWVRHPNGDYQPLRNANLLHPLNNQIYYYRTDTRQFAAYHLNTRRFSQITPAQFEAIRSRQAVSPEFDLAGTSSHSVARLQLGRQQNGRWIYTPLPFESKDLDW